MKQMLIENLSDFIFNLYYIFLIVYFAKYDISVEIITMIITKMR